MPMTRIADSFAASRAVAAARAEKPRPVNTAAKASATSLESQLPPDWRKALSGEFDKPYFKQLEKFLAVERRDGKVLPPPDKVFAALKATPLDKVKVVLLGQDPYPTAGNANGLSFSVGDGQKIPRSLQNMFKVAHSDVGTPMPNNGNLTPWTKQGVLLLNTVLTVREGQPDSHAGHGWELFTQAILDVVNQKQKGAVFMLLGKQAQEVATPHVDTKRNSIVAAPHPSPMTPGNPFAKSHPFSEVNKALAAAGKTPIDWTIPNR
jgi:uracil-DNA glycosylase